MQNFSRKFPVRPDSRTYFLWKKFPVLPDFLGRIYRKKKRIFCTCIPSLPDGGLTEKPVGMHDRVPPYPGMPGRAGSNGARFDPRWSLPEKFLCLIRSFICPFFREEREIGGFWHLSLIFSPETCHYRPLAGPEKGGGQAPVNKRNRPCPGGVLWRFFKGVGFLRRRIPSGFIFSTIWENYVPLLSRIKRPSTLR